MDCDKCPIREECGGLSRQNECPLVALVYEWKLRASKKLEEWEHDKSNHVE